MQHSHFRSFLSRHLIRRGIGYILLWLWAMLFFSLPVSAETTPRFGSGIVFLGLPEGDKLAHDPGTMLYPVEMSVSGRYVTGVVCFSMDENHPERTCTLYAWDLYEATPNGEYSNLGPTRSLYVGTWRNYPWMPQKFMALSPDERYLALGLDTQLQILTIPELAVYKTITIASEAWLPQVIWTPDSEQVIFKDGTEVVVWDKQTDVLYRHDLEGDYVLEPFGDEWLLQPRAEQASSVLFTICSNQFQQCTPYEYPGEVSVLNPARKVIVTRRLVDEYNWMFGIWTRQEDGQYTVTEGQFDKTVVIEPEAFSPSGQYLLLTTRLSGEIWDFTTFEPVQVLLHDYTPVWLDGHEISWLTNDEFFVTLELHQVESTTSYESEIGLYHMGQEIPLDMLNLDSLAAREGIRIDGETRGIRGISDDGQWVMVSIGQAAVIIPVVYE